MLSFRRAFTRLAPFALLGSLLLGSGCREDVSGPGGGDTPIPPSGFPPIPVAHYDNLSASPDGRWLAARQERPVPPGTSRTGFYSSVSLYRLTADPATGALTLGAGREVIGTQDLSLTGSDWGHDALTGDPNGRYVFSDGPSLWTATFDLDSARFVGLQRLTPPGWNVSPRLSPDGETVAYIKVDCDPCGIYLRSIRSPPTAPSLQKKLQYGGSPEWSLDGKTLYHVAQQAGGAPRVSNQRIFVSDTSDAQGAHRRQLLQLNVSYADIRYLKRSPKGQYLAFQAAGLSEIEVNSPKLYTLRLSDSNLTLIDSRQGGGGKLDMFTWMPDGRLFYLRFGARNDADENTLWTVQPDGSGRQPVTITEPLFFPPRGG